MQILNDYITNGPGWEQRLTVLAPPQLTRWWLYRWGDVTASVPGSYRSLGGSSLPPLQIRGGYLEHPSLWSLLRWIRATLGCLDHDYCTTNEKLYLEYAQILANVWRLNPQLFSVRHSLAISLLLNYL